MVSSTFRTAGDGKPHYLTERNIQSQTDQRVTVTQLPVDLSGSSSGLGLGYLLVGMGTLDLPLASNAVVTYHHSDPSRVIWNDLGQVLVLSAVWSPDQSPVFEQPGPGKL